MLIRYHAEVRPEIVFKCLCLLHSTLLPETGSLTESVALCFWLDLQSVNPDKSPFKILLYFPVLSPQYWDKGCARPFLFFCFLHGCWRYECESSYYTTTHAFSHIHLPNLQCPSELTLGKHTIPLLFSFLLCFRNHWFYFCLY